MLNVKICPHNNSKSLYVHNGGGVEEVVVVVTLLFVLGSKLFSISFSKRPSSRVPTLGDIFVSLEYELKSKVNTNFIIRITNNNCMKQFYLEEIFKDKIEISTNNRLYILDYFKKYLRIK